MRNLLKRQLPYNTVWGIMSIELLSPPLPEPHGTSGLGKLDLVSMDARDYTYVVCGIKL